MPVIALDAMGGDAAPGPEIAGAVAAARHGIDVIVVGDERRLRDALAPYGEVPRLRVQHASEVVTMDDHPAQAFRQKRDSSLRVATELVVSARAQAVVSAGNSGAVLAAAVFTLGRLPGVERPAIVTVLPTPAGPLTLCDAGANVDPRPAMLAQFGLLGACYDRVVHGRARPRVGLLANGGEASKGTELTRAAHAILLEVATHTAMQYAGYVEGSDLFRGAIDVAVTDGFTGNVVLKTCEGIAEGLFGMLRQELAGTAATRVGAALIQPALRRLARQLDYAETGGALLAGVKGVAVLAHGRSSAAAIEQAIRAAARFVDGRLVEQLGAAITQHGAIWREAAAAVTPAT